VKIITDISAKIIIKRPVITIGTFDGIHIGHRAILQETVVRARSGDVDSAVVTFNPHPRIVLGQSVSLLNTRDEKRSIIENTGISHLIEIPFTVEFSDLEADEFIKLIVDALNPSTIIIGYDHGFGRNRSGDIQQLEQAGKILGFDVVNIEAIEADDQKISSSVIRSLLQKGDVKAAARLLGQYYEISGSVIRGNQIGKLLGYPTANIYIDDPYKLIPSIGVYAAYVHYNNHLYQGMTNIGLRPTINAHQLTIETNIFDFDDDIYYERISIQLVERIRDEKKFDNLDVLRNQLKADKDATLRILNFSDS
jgi:riboflavin kinase / FMN adenylyltransferase